MVLSVWTIPALLALFFEAVFAGTVAVCQYLYPVYTYYYRLRLDVELPDGAMRSGLSFVAVSIWSTP